MKKKKHNATAMLPVPDPGRPKSFHVLPITAARVVPRALGRRSRSGTSSPYRTASVGVEGDERVRGGGGVLK